MCPQKQPLLNGDIKSNGFKKLMARILEKGKVNKILLVTDSLTMKMPKYFQVFPQPISDGGSDF